MTDTNLDTSGRRSGSGSSPMPWIAARWSAIVVAAAAAVLVPSGLAPEAAWRWGVVAAGLLGAIGVRTRGLPWSLSILFVVGTTHLAVSSVFDGVGGTLWDDPAAGLPVTISTGVLMWFGLVALTGSRRPGRWWSARDGVDLVAVAIGAGVVAWEVAAGPIAMNVSTTAGLVAAMSLPLSFSGAVIAVDAAASGSTTDPAVRLATSAAVVNVIATWIWGLSVAGVVPEGMAGVGPAGLIAAICLLSAAVTHDAPPCPAPASPIAVDRSDSPIRIAVLGVAVGVPVASIAVLPAADNGLVRAVGMSLLVMAIVVRLLIATHQHRTVRDTLEQQLTRDDLTGLANRSRFASEVADILEATWHSPHRATVIQLNLDRFKNINDNFGHYAANEVLTVIGGRLRGIADDIGAIVARVGGDDFALVLGQVSSTDEAIEHAEAVRSVLAAPIPIGDMNVFVTASLGVTSAPRNRTTAAEELMRQADIAAHHAKVNGRNRIEVFDESMQARLTRRMDVEHALHGAIGRREMRLYHQPIIDLVTGRVSGFEALMRWERQDGTIVSPADFIPVAEETGIICELGAWAIRDALGELRRWIDSGVVAPTTTMSVNVSPRQIADPGFPDIVRSAVAASGVAPQLLWLEITESMMLDEPELANRTLDEIRAMGIRIALDDFGTGFSSLSLLQKFPIHRIKIDRAFVRDIGQDTNDRSLVRTIIAMAKSMQLDLVAEGVETTEQLETLRDLGCDKAQGFLVSRPVHPDAMRSTMTALDELCSLSIFEAVPPAVDTPAADPAPVRRAPEFAMAVPMGPVSSRPLGSPRL